MLEFMRCLAGRCRNGGCPAAILIAATVLAGCHRATSPLVEQGRSAVALSAGPNTSMIYLARTAEGVVVIDLGWWGRGRGLNAALAAIGATRSDVRWAFLTHSHRDHIAAWKEVRQARFVMASGELSRFFGQTEHRGWIARWADRLWPTRLPRPNEVAVTTFTTDTSFAFGSDTLHAYVVPGHTPGSAVYLFRNVLFVGDAITWSRWRGFGPAKPRVSDDPALATHNLAALWARLPSSAVRYVCTAHAHCAPFSARFVNARTQ